MKRTILMAMVVLAIATLVVAASAEPIYKPNIIKIGGTWPTNGDVRDATQSIWFYAGYERVLSEMPDSRSDITAEVGWTRASGEYDGDDYEARAIPILVNWRQHAANDGMGSSSMFYGVGAGAYLFRGEEDGDSMSKTKFGIAPFVGVEGANWQVELKYHFIGKIEDVRVDNLLLTAGFRF